MVKRRSPAWAKRTKARLRERDGDCCCWCHAPMLFDLLPNSPGQPRHPDLATLEHIIPLSGGGSNDDNNLALAHYRCNLENNRKARAQPVAEAQGALP